MCEKYNTNLTQFHIDGEEGVHNVSTHFTMYVFKNNIQRLSTDNLNSILLKNGNENFSETCVLAIKKMHNAETPFYVLL